MLTISWLTAQS